MSIYSYLIFIVFAIWIFRPKNKPKYKLIGLMGSVGSGKSTFAQSLHWYYNEDYFAKPLKQICSIVINGKPEIAREFTDQKLKETKLNNHNFTPRKLMQFVGTEMFREKIAELDPELGTDLWVKLMDRRTLKEKPTIVSDVRFKNEAEWIKKRGGIIVLIKRNQTGSGTEHSNHSSELEHREIEPDIIIENNGSVDDFVKKIRSLFLIPYRT